MLLVHFPHLIKAQEEREGHGNRNLAVACDHFNAWCYYSLSFTGNPEAYSFMRSSVYIQHSEAGKLASGGQAEQGAGRPPKGAFTFPVPPHPPHQMHLYPFAVHSVSFLSSPLVSFLSWVSPFHFLLPLLSESVYTQAHLTLTLARLS
jgi:hypothetical protein